MKELIHPDNRKIVLRPDIRGGRVEIDPIYTQGHVIVTGKGGSVVPHGTLIKHATMAELKNPDFFAKLAKGYPWHRGEKVIQAAKVKSGTYAGQYACFLPIREKLLKKYIRAVNGELVTP